MTSRQWVRVAVPVALEGAELAADVLWQSGAAGIEEQDDGGRTVLLGGFADPRAGSHAVEALTDAGFDGAQLLPVDDDGLDAWRAFARPMRAGRLWVVPPWIDAPATAAHGEVLWIDPGRAFGSGSHPTTRLVLAALERRVQPGHRVLDVGCGSGVLAVAAARLGAELVVAVDPDPAATAATTANADRNGVGSCVHASVRPLNEVVTAGERFDVVAANLLAPIIRELSVDLVTATGPGGTLIVSGLLADRWEPDVAGLAPLTVVRVDEDDGWAAVELG